MAVLERLVAACARHLSGNLGRGPFFPEREVVNVCPPPHHALLHVQRRCPRREEEFEHEYGQGAPGGMPAVGCHGSPSAPSTR
eukprot:33134-Lingulodinium_polyedra.AAC.1